MGNAAGSLSKHIETAEKTGALNFTEKGLEKFPPDLVKVGISQLQSAKRSLKNEEMVLTKGYP